MTAKGSSGSGNPYEGAVLVTSMEVEQGRKPSPGSWLKFEDGRVFRRCRTVAGGDTIPLGDLLTSGSNVDQAIAATKFGVDDSTGPAAGQGGSIGDTTIMINKGISAVTANEYAGGYVHVVSAAGLGQLRKIKSHAATDATNGILFEIYEPLDIALTNASVGWIFKAPYMDVLSSATITEVAVGVSVGIITTNAVAQDFWAQTWGLCAVRTKVVVAMGKSIGGNAENGEAGITTGAQGDDITDHDLGHARIASTAEDTFAVVQLRIDPGI